MAEWKTYQEFGDAVLEYARACRVIDQAELEAARAAQKLIERFGFDPARQFGRASADTQPSRKEGED